MDSLKTFDKKIDSFLKRYYKALIIKGLIIAIVLFCIITFLLASLEFVFWFNSSIRLILLSFLITSLIFTLYYFILIPVLKYYKVFKRIPNNEIANIISRGYPNLNDYVSNIFELRNQDLESNELLIAAINQKIEYTKGYSFDSIVNFKKVYNSIKFLIVVIAVYFIVFSFKPDVIVDSTKRIINFNENFIKDVGFSFDIDTSKLYVERGHDLAVNFKVLGDEIPSYVTIFIGNNEYLCTKQSNTDYEFLIKNINNNLSFRLGNNNFKSESYNVNVISSPYLKNIIIDVMYPSYINIDDETFTNNYNLKVPIGSILRFKLKTNFTNLVRYNSYNSLDVISEDNNFSIDDTVYKSFNYSILGYNSSVYKPFIDKGTISVIPDLYPEISVMELSDKNDNTIKYFKGFILDDYGFSSLFFVINGEEISVNFNKNLNEQEFYFTYKFEQSNSDKNFNYFFKVADNDEVNGYKETFSNTFNFIVPNFNELSKFKSSEDKKIEEKLEKSMLLAQELKKDIEAIQNKLFSEELSGYEKKQILDDLNSKQKSLNEILNDLTKSYNEKNTYLNSFENSSENIKEKQQQIQDLLENIMNDELKDLLSELEKLAEDFNKDQINKQLQNLDFNYDKLNEQLDRNLELLVKYEIENNLERIKEELNNLSEKNLSYSDSLFNSETLDSTLNKDLTDVEKLQEIYKDNLSKNEDLEKPLDMSNFDEEFEDLKKSIENSNSKENTDQKNNFKENSEKAKDLADKIDSMLNNNRVNENAENAETLRQILENLIYFSFNQETLIENFVSISQNSPSFIDNTVLQQNLRDVYIVIKDSLVALSKRTPQIGKHINDKVYGIENNLELTNDLLLDRKVGNARIKQRKILENSNDLILLLSESLKNMENSSGGGGGSSGKKKNKPKQGEPSLSEMRKSQESLKSQLEGMIKQMKSGNGKPGSEQLAKMLAQQEMFQSMMNQFMQQGKVGSDLLKELNEINKMLDQNKRDLINNNVSNSTLYRQNKIVTRLLQSEKAEKERELDEKRESKESNNHLVSDPVKMFEEREKSSNFNDILRKNNIRLNYFYQNKYQEYIKSLN